MGRHSRDVMNRVEGFHPVSRCWLMEDQFIDFIGTSKKSHCKASCTQHRGVVP